MSAVIYETINIYNRDNNILPYKYIGSDQHNKPNYFGSNKNLLKDIKLLGKQYFEKKIIYEFSDDISNVLLRKIESQLQKSVDAAGNSEYYNRTNSSHKGYVETDEEKSNRMKKTHIAYRKWWDGLSDEDKNNHRNKCVIAGKNNGMKNKSYYDLYGEHANEQRMKISGRNNGNSKQVLDIQTGIVFGSMFEAMKFYNIKKHSTLKNKCNKGILMKFI